MANEQNLTAPKFQSGESAKEAGRKGGRVSAHVRQQKRAMRDALELEIKNRGGDPQLAKTAIDIILSKNPLVTASMKIKALEYVRDTRGEKPADEVVMNPVIVKDDI